MSSRFMDSAERASQRARSYSQDRPEIRQFTSDGNHGLVFQELGSELSIKKVKNLTPHGNREPLQFRFD